MNEFSPPIETALDQPTFDNDDASFRMMEEVDRKIDEAADDIDLRKALDVVIDLGRAAHLAGVGLATAFYGMFSRWEKFSGQTFPSTQERQDHFEQVMYDRLGRSKNTIRRYLIAGSLLAGLESRVLRLPFQQREELKRAMPQRNVIDLIAIGQYEREHGSLSPRQLEEVAYAEDTATVRKLLRTYRNAPEKPFSFFMLTPDGTLEFWEDGRFVRIGFLNIVQVNSEMHSRGLAKIRRHLGLGEPDELQPEVPER